MPEFSFRSGKDLKAEMAYHQKMLEETAQQREVCTMKGAKILHALSEELRKGTPEIADAAESDIYDLRTRQFEHVVRLTWGTRIMRKEEVSFKDEVDKAVISGAPLGPLQTRRFPHRLGPFESWQIDLAVAFLDPKAGSLALWGEGLVEKLFGLKVDDIQLTPKIVDRIKRVIGGPPVCMGYNLTRRGYLRFEVRNQ